MITIAADKRGHRRRAVKKAFFIVEPNHEQLVQIARMLDADELKTDVGAVLPLAQASAAYTGAVKRKKRPRQDRHCRVAEAPESSR